MSWFAANTKHKGEFKAMDFFTSIGVNSYVPSYKTKKVWSDRIKKVTIPAITGYVFFELSKIDFKTINLNPYTRNVVLGINGQPAIIKQNEINNLKNHFEDFEIENVEKLFEGQKIKINSGPFIYKKGTIKKLSCNKVKIMIEALNISLIIKKSSVAAA